MKTDAHPTPFPPEFQLLLACSHYQGSPGSQARLEHRVTVPLDWEVLHREAQWHGITPLLHAHLGRHGLGPATERARWQGIARNTLAHNMQLNAELLRLDGLLRNRGWKYLWFKGPIAAEACPDRPGLRSYGDLDLLIEPDRFMECLHWLRQEGYSPQFSLPDPLQERQFQAFGELMFQHRSQNRVIDLHGQLVRGGYAFARPLSKAWERTRRVQVEGVPVPTLSLEDTLLYYALHLGKHQWDRLKWLIDMAELLRIHAGRDGSKTWNLDITDSNRRLIGIGLRLAADLLDAPLPDPLRRQIPTDDAFQSVYHVARQRLAAGSTFTGAATEWPWKTPYFRAMTGAGDRCLHLYDVLLQPTPMEWQLWPVGAPWSALHFLLRPVRLTFRALQRALGSGHPG